MRRILQSEFLFPIVTFIVGLAIGLLLNDVPYLTFDKTVSLGEISNIIIALIVAIYIPFFLDKTIKGKRLEKEMILEKFDSLESQLDFQMEAVMKLHLKEDKVTKEEANELVLRVRALSNALVRLGNSCKTLLENQEINTQIEKLKDIQNKYWYDLTVNLKDKNPQISSDAYIRTSENVSGYLENISVVKSMVNRI